MSRGLEVWRARMTGGGSGDWASGYGVRVDSVGCCDFVLV